MWQNRGIVVKKEGIVMIKAIKQSERDFALNIGRIFEYRCDCGSFGEIHFYSDLDDSGSPIQQIECPECDKSLTN